MVTPSISYTLDAVFMATNMPSAFRKVHTGIATCLLFALIHFLLSNCCFSNGENAPLSVRRRDVGNAFDHAWIGYSTLCMGHDSLHPVSNTCNDDFGGWGATAIDALSTAIIMEKTEVVIEILRFIETIDFEVVKGGKNIQLFEVTIRHFGGMISAWDLLTGPFEGMVKDDRLKQTLYSQMVRLGDALSCAFDTPSGIPRNWVDPAACVSDDGTSNAVAGAGTLILEFTRLSDITGNQQYARLAQRAEAYLLNPWPQYGEPFPGLLGSFLSVDDGHLLDSKGSWGSLADCKPELQA